jgi:hypothetical protein
VGNSSSAIKSFKKAMRIFSRAIDGTTTLLRVGTDHLHRVKSCSTFLRNHFLPPGLHDTNFYTYDRHLNIPLTRKASMLPVYSAIVLFNLALASLNGKNPRTEIVKIASHLYSIDCEYSESGSTMMKICPPSYLACWTTS